MREHFFEIVFVGDDWQFDGRDEIEDPLEAALIQVGIGEVTGGGAGLGKCNIDVEATDFARALAIIRAVLTQLKVAPSTEINYFHDATGQRQTFSVYE